jgi:AraC family transcriptional regulator
MVPAIYTIPGKLLVGARLTMSHINNTTHELWKGFMPLRGTITDSISSDRYSLQMYPENYFEPFNPAAVFEKWAAVEVTSFDDVPAGMETLTLPGGLYAVFQYVGNPANGAKIFQEIFTQWLPQSGYALDNRPHFEILGDKYRNGSNDSEEQIWIPIK